MIKKLKRKFTLLATVSVFVLMTVLVGIMNIINFSSVAAEADTVLDILSQPNLPFEVRQGMPEKPHDKIKDFIPRGMSPEVPYESRYFTATVSNGVLEKTDVSRIVSVSEADVQAYVNKAAASSRDRGFIEQFRYMKQTDGEKTRLIFLDCGRKLDQFYGFMLTSAAVGLLGCVIVFAVFLLAASLRLRR